MEKSKNMFESQKNKNNLHIIALLFSTFIYLFFLFIYLFIFHLRKEVFRKVYLQIM